MKAESRSLFAASDQNEPEGDVATIQDLATKEPPD